MAGAAVVEFVFGLGSRYSCLASTQLGRIRQKTGCELLWPPVSSVEIMNLRSRSPFLGAPVSMLRGNDRLVLLEHYPGTRR